MKRQVRLYIGGQEADLGEGDLILFNYTQEDLSNPTIVKNSYTQQVTLKGTPTNNDIFGHIWRLDRTQQFGGSTGQDFDPSRKTGFQLFDGAGQLLESGYVKLDNILRHGADIQYSVTLYGGLGSFLYGLSFDTEGNRKTLASLDYLASGDPDRELDFTIDAGAVQTAWSRLLSNPAGVTDIWDVINFAPCYNGIPDRFGADKALVKPSEIGLQDTHPEDSSYGLLNGWALLKMTKNMTEWETKDLRSYMQRPVVSVKAVLNAIANAKNNGGFTFDASVLEGSDYDGMWMTLPLLPSLESYKNVSQSITLTLDGSAHSDTFSVPVSIGTSLQVGSKVDVNMNIAFAATVQGATATPLYFSSAKYSGGIGTTERYDFSGFFAQLVAYDGQDRPLTASKVICVGSSEDYGQFAKDGKVRADACGFSPVLDMDYTFVEAVLAGASGSYNLSTDINLSLSCYNAEKYRIHITPYHFRKTIHFGELYRKTWRSHAVGTDAMRVYFGGTEYTYTAMRLSSGTAGSTASYKTPESIRSGAAVTKAMLLTTDYSPADFLLGIVKSLGLILHYDGTTGVVTLMSKNNYFKADIIDIDQRIDRGRDVQIAPLAFDTKWLEMSSDALGGAFEKYYSDVYGSQYGVQRIGTGYDFNTESKKIMDSVVFRSGVQACENSRYFNDVTAGGDDVLSQQLDSGNVLTYRNASGDTKDYEVPVVSSPDIAYWGSPSFQDVEGYDWLTACKLQCHDTDGKSVDGSGVLLFRSGVQRYDRFQISDDLPEMMTLNDGTPCWCMDAGAGVTVPVFTRYKSQSMYAIISTSPLVAEYRGEGVLTALDFGRVQELACPHMAYFPSQESVTIYEKMWRAYIRDRYNVNTRVVTAWVNMAGIQVNGESLRKFYWFDNSLWSLNRVINYSVTTDDPVQCEFVKVQDKAAYLYGQNFGGAQARGVLDLTVTPATASVVIDGTSVALTDGHATVTLTAGQHVVRASASGYATAEQVVSIIPDETVTVSLTLAPGVEQLNIIVEPSDATPIITLTIDGVSTPYAAGMNVSDGAVVVITVQASGYARQTRTVTMSPANATQYFTLVADNEATVSWPSSVSAAAQNVPFTVSDPSNHGWTLDFDGPDAYGFVTGGGVTSGNATYHRGYITGTGNAVVYLTIQENATSTDRSINTYPFYFEDETTHTRTSISIEQRMAGGGDVKVTSIVLSPSSLSLNTGSSSNIVAYVYPTNATNKSLTWTSSDESVATVNQAGRVTAVGAGTCYIRAYSTDGSNKVGECTVTVTGQTVAVTGVTLNESNITVSAGQSRTLIATVLPTNATNKSVVWESDDTSIATVSDGVVTGVAAGWTNVSVQTVDGGYIANCIVEVAVSGVLSAADVTAKGVQTTASSKLTATNMNLSSLQVSWPSSATWLRTVEIDTSGGEYYIRMTMYQNTATSPYRETTVTITGTDLGGVQKTATFTVRQNLKSTSDIPCTGMEIGGATVINNSGNEATYNAVYRPSGCTQTGCTWSLQSGASYAEITPNAHQCTVTVKPGANGDTVVLRATNSFNTSIYADITITVTYVAATAIEVNPASVTVNFDATSDQTPTVSAPTAQSGSLTVKSVSGFIESAVIRDGRLVTAFSENASQTAREGSVVLLAIVDGEGQEATVSYLQAGRTGTTNSFAISKLSVLQMGGNVQAKFVVNFLNSNPTDYTFYGLYATLVGYDANDGQVFTKVWSLGNKTVGAITIETETYTQSWKGTIGMADHYTLTVTDQQQTSTYSGNGDDIIN